MNYAKSVHVYMPQGHICTIAVRGQIIYNNMSYTALDNFNIPSHFNFKLEVLYEIHDHDMQQLQLFINNHLYYLSQELISYNNQLLTLVKLFLYYEFYTVSKCYTRFSARHIIKSYHQDRKCDLAHLQSSTSFFRQFVATRCIMDYLWEYYIDFLYNVIISI